jgi:hypothetical protein
MCKRFFRWKIEVESWRERERALRELSDDSKSSLAPLALGAFSSALKLFFGGRINIPRHRFSE